MFAATEQKVKRREVGQKAVPFGKNLGINGGLEPLGQVNVLWRNGIPEIRYTQRFAGSESLGKTYASLPPGFFQEPLQQNQIKAEQFYIPAQVE